MTQACARASLCLGYYITGPSALNKPLFLDRNLITPRLKAWVPSPYHFQGLQAPYPATVRLLFVCPFPLVEFDPRQCVGRLGFQPRPAERHSSLASHRVGKSR